MEPDEGTHYFRHRFQMARLHHCGAILYHAHQMGLQLQRSEIGPSPCTLSPLLIGEQAHGLLLHVVQGEMGARNGNRTRATAIQSDGLLIVLLMGCMVGQTIDKSHPRCQG